MSNKKKMYVFMTLALALAFIALAVFNYCMVVSIILAPIAIMCAFTSSFYERLVDDDN